MQAADDANNTILSDTTIIHRLAGLLSYYCLSCYQNFGKTATIVDWLPSNGTFPEKINKVTCYKEILLNYSATLPALL